MINMPTVIIHQKKKIFRTPNSQFSESSRNFNPHYITKQPNKINLLRHYATGGKKVFFAMETNYNSVYVTNRRTQNYIH